MFCSCASSTDVLELTSTARVTVTAIQKRTHVCATLVGKATVVICSIVLDHRIAWIEGAVR